MCLCPSPRLPEALKLPTSYSTTPGRPTGDGARSCRFSAAQQPCQPYRHLRLPLDRRQTAHALPVVCRAYLRIQGSRILTCLSLVVAPEHSLLATGQGPKPHELPGQHPLQPLYSRGAPRRSSSCKLSSLPSQLFQSPIQCLPILMSHPCRFPSGQRRDNFFFAMTLLHMTASYPLSHSSVMPQRCNTCLTGMRRTGYTMHLAHNVHRRVSSIAAVPTARMIDAIRTQRTDMHRARLLSPKRHHPFN